MRLLGLLSLSLFAVACTHFSTTPLVTRTSDLSAPLPPEAAKVSLEKSESEIPMEYNQAVKKWIAYFQGRGRKHMNKFLERSGYYMPVMLPILKRENLPEDLIYVVFVESGFSAQAHSRASAVGFWQFMRGTGKQYGLRINGYVDERRDPIKSTEAAARYFRALYNLFGDWYLALAAYNSGENRVKRVVMNSDTRDFWTIARRKKLPLETRNYIPKFLATMTIAKHPEKYGFSGVNYASPMDFESIKPVRAVSLSKLARNMKLSLKTLKKLNPEFRSDYVPSYKRTTIRVPKGTHQVALAAISSSYTTRQVAAASGATYSVRRGDNLSVIAKRFNTTVSKIRAANRIGRRSILYVGQNLKIPGATSRYLVKTEPKGKAPRPDAPREEAQYHVVRRGENLSLIAQKYGVSLANLSRWNNLSNRSLLRVGQKLSLRQGSSAVPADYHVVKSGENLTLIAQRYGVSISQLRSENNMRRRSILRVGQKLRLPGNASSRVHVIRPGETLIHIARKYDVPLVRLTRVNDIENRSRILVGSKLVIPD